MAPTAKPAGGKAIVGANAGGKEKSEALYDRFYSGHRVRAVEEGSEGC